MYRNSSFCTDGHGFQEAFILVSTFCLALLLGFLFANNIACARRHRTFYLNHSFWFGLLGLLIFIVAAFLLVGNILTTLLETISFAIFEIQSTDGMQFFPFYFLAAFLCYLVSYLLQTHFRNNSFFLQVIYFFLISGISYHSVHFDLAVMRIFEQDLAERLPLFRELLWGSLAFLLVYLVVAHFQARRFFLVGVERELWHIELFRPKIIDDLQKIINALLPEAPKLREISGKDLPIAQRLSRDLAHLPLLSKLGLKFSIFFIKLSPFIFFKIPVSFLYLSPAKQESVLQKIETSKIVAIKLPLMILKLFVWQIYYEDPRAYKALGFNAESLGIFRKKIFWN